MIRSFGKWLVLLLLSPLVRTEPACRGTPVADAYGPIIADPAEQRAESRTLRTYPEWHIVHADDDCARVIATGDPYDFHFFHAIRGFWSALCPLTRTAAGHGGVTGETKTTIYPSGSALPPNRR